MGKHTIFVTLALTFVWIILLEEISWQTAAIGMFMSMLAMHFTAKFLNFEEIQKVSFFKLAMYPFWMVVRIYMDAIFLVKLIFSNPKWGIITQELKLENESLRIILSESITLTPGSVFVEREGDEIKLLCIGSRKKKGYPVSREGLRSIENILMRAQKE